MLQGRRSVGSQQRLYIGCIARQSAGGNAAGRRKAAANGGCSVTAVNAVSPTESKIHGNGGGQLRRTSHRGHDNGAAGSAWQGGGVRRQAVRLAGGGAARQTHQ